QRGEITNPLAPFFMRGRQRLLYFRRLHHLQHSFSTCHRQRAFPRAAILVELLLSSFVLCQEKRISDANVITKFKYERSPLVAFCREVRGRFSSASPLFEPGDRFGRPWGEPTVLEATNNRSSMGACPSLR